MKNKKNSSYKAHRKVFLGLAMLFILLISINLGTSGTFDDFEDGSINGTLWNTYADTSRQANVETINDFFSDGITLGNLTYTVTNWDSSPEFKSYVGGIEVYNQTSPTDGTLSFRWFPDTELMAVHRNGSFFAYTDLSGRSDLQLSFNFTGSFNAGGNSSVSETSGYLQLSVTDGGLGNRVIRLDNLDYGSTTGLQASLISPPNDTFTPNNSQYFTGNFTVDSSMNLTNATLYVWNNDGSLFRTNSTDINGLSNSSTLHLSNFNTLNLMSWNYYACAANSSSVDCSFAQNNLSFTPNNFNFGLCNASNIYRVVNYTMYDQNSLGNLTTSFDATFNYHTDSASFNKTFSYSSTSNNYTFQFCSDQDKIYYTVPKIFLELGGYHNKNYYFPTQEYDSNPLTEEFLFMLPNTNGTNVIIELKDAGLIPLNEYFIEVSRYYPGTDTYRKIIVDQTDEFGQIVGKLIENTVKYKFTFKNPLGTTVKTTNDITIACRSSICVLPFVIEDTTDDFERFENVTNYDYSLSFDNSTNIFTFSWEDFTGDSITSRLEVTRYLTNGSSIVCDTQSTSSASSLTCNVGGQTASYKAQAFRQVSGQDEIRMTVLNIKIGSNFGTFGLEGLFWSFLLLMIFISVGSYWPPAGIILYTTGYTALGLIGIISFNASLMIATVAIGGIFIWALRL